MHHRQNYSKMWSCVSSCIVCNSRLCFVFIAGPLFSQQRKWAELMHVMEIKSPSKSQAVFCEMQNHLHCIVTEQRHTKNLDVLLFWGISFHTYWAPLISIKGRRNARSLGWLWWKMHFSYLFHLEPQHIDCIVESHTGSCSWCYPACVPAEKSEELWRVTQWGMLTALDQGLSS